MKTFKKYLDKIFSKVLLFGMILLIAMVIIVFTNVVLRYGFASGIKWSEEVSLVIVVWFTFIAMALGVKENLHISITLLPHNMPKVINDSLDIIKYVAEIFVGYIMLRYGWLLTQNGLRSFLPATHITNAINYVVLPINAIFIILYATYYLYVAITDLRSKSSDKENKTNV